MIIDVKAREIIDSRANPTIEVEIITEKGKFFGRAPSGVSKSKKESVEIRDKNYRFHGKGVLKAVDKIKEIKKVLINKDESEHEEIDKALIALDGTKNKSKLGSNTIVATSMAVARAGACKLGLELYEYIGLMINTKSFTLPLLFMNVINGGKHAGNDLAIQEFMIIPQAPNVKERIRLGCEMYYELKEEIKKKYGKSATNVGDEGGFAPPLKNTTEALELLMKIIEKGYDAKLALDCAASEFYKNDIYKLDKRVFDTNELLEYYKQLVEKYPILSIEDPFDQNDIHGFKEITKELKSIQIVGDDLLATNPLLILNAIKNNLCNTLLLKINQIGTLTEALESFRLAKNNNWNTIVSHRSGETCDDFIADLSVGIACGQIKAGAPCRGERTSKYNRLIRIEEMLNE